MTVVRNMADPGYVAPEAPPAPPKDYDDRWIDVREGWTLMLTESDTDCTDNEHD